MLPAGAPLEKPWAARRHPADRKAYLITYAMIVVGVLGGAARCFLGWQGVPVLKGDLCPVLDEDFSSPERVFGEGGTFFREVDLSGFGNGQFEMTTDTDDTAYVQDGQLYITPRLTSDLIGEDAVLDGHIFNATGCTYNTTGGGTYTSQTLIHPQDALLAEDTFDAEAYQRACSAVSNVTSGLVINPVRSARLTTRYSASMRYGRVEVRAKIPSGDWLWPAIWMLPTDNVYGRWPLSGEIDIMESRGNGPEYAGQGTNHVRGSLHWGPSPALNAVWRTTGWWALRRGAYARAFHTYALEWDEEFIRIYVDNRLHHMLTVKINKPFWDTGKFPKIADIGGETVMTTNIWANGTAAAPFDQKFYLILNVAVGGTNGWFPDAKEKPWFDRSATAMLEFWRARGEWYPTWGDAAQRSMIVDSVKMWEKC